MQPCGAAEEGLPASLQLYDVTGRQLGSREVGGGRPGLHAVKLADWVPPGIYVVRLSQAGRSRRKIRGTKSGARRSVICCGSGKFMAWPLGGAPTTTRFSSS